DLDECKDKIHQCDVNANCTNIPGSYNCTCRPGYTGNGNICNGIISYPSLHFIFLQCKDGSHDCHINTNCTNTAGSYNCTCRPGYTGNGSICRDVDECADNLHDCDANAKCKNIPGSYSCVCNPPYNGDGKKCIKTIDLDECKDKIHQCDVNANCTNIPGSYNCTCRPGYTGNGSICNGIISYPSLHFIFLQCKDGSHDCHINTNCTNTAGSYNCTCRPGYTGNGSICRDVDECADNLHDCDANAKCKNIPGSYSCVCNPPYNGDGKKC
ncbi:unnamed protein product, partial [Porites lobata]